ncbi:hypothetical protein ROZALSC1DRAFT_29999 [Rozella allomycis CSF55]|uniref:Uncharacterized protein n=1 Tax=Rozella allomycis (strain CSF55) TaxID=988480 RepID=A0A4P9YFL6_ROZAC|nr:hypothetical protein ROZALSC1DRAFT_29999 [Rozella allomycis CSF55]
MTAVNNRIRLNSVTKADPIVIFKNATAVAKIVTHLSEPIVSIKNKRKKMAMQIANSMMEIEFLAPLCSNNAFLARHGFDVLFPNAFQIATGYVPADKKLGFDFKSLLTHFSLVNQVLSISTQLHRDITLQNHKYIAHQIALLYQSINSVSGLFNEFKHTIEEGFDDIKATLNESGGIPQLSISQKQW